MGQFVLPTWLELIGYIFSTISTFLGLFASIYLIQKAKLENQKTRLENQKIKLETRKLELEVLEKESKVKGKKKSPQKSISEVSPSNKNSAITKILGDIQSGENRLTDYIFMILTPFKEDSANVNYQRVAGSVIELGFLLLFLYADASFGAQNLALLFPTDFPDFFKSTALPLVISSVGTTFILGIMIGDLSGLTSLTFWSNFREKKNPYLAIMLITLIVNILLSLLIAIYQTNLIVLLPENIHSSILPFGFLGQSLIITPMLVTTAFLFNALYGLLTIGASLVFILRIPVTLTRKVVVKIKYYFYD